MKHLFLKFTKKRFLHLFFGICLLLGSQEMKAVVYTTIASGPWTTSGTWDSNGIPPAATTTADIININHAVTHTLTANFTVGALNISSGGGLTVSQFDTTARSFTLGILAPGSTIAGPLLFDLSSTGSKSFGKVTVTATGSVIETTKVSISMNNGVNGVLTNYGTITTGSLAMSGNGGNLMKIDNYGTINCTGFSSTTVGTFTNFSTGVFNYTGGTFPIGMNFIASALGNTVDYGSSTSQVIQTPISGIYSNLILSGVGTKTFPQSADVTVGNLTIGAGVTLRITSASVSSVTITNGGSGYGTSAPIVTFSAAPIGGTLTAGTAVLTSGAVTSISITNPGSGYTTAPTITFASGAAAATAILTSLPTAYKFTVTGTTTNNGTLDFVTIAGTGDKTFATCNNPGTITSAASANFIFNTANYSGAAQTILPGTYTNLTLSNSGTKTIAASKTVTIASGGVLIVNEGTLLNNVGTITNNGELLLKSSATGTASLTSSSSINNVTQQRYLSSNQRGWRLLSNPLDSTSFNTLASASNITFGTNFTGEYVSGSNTWTSTDGTATMDTQKAYKVFITGPSFVTLVNKGTATNTVPTAINTVPGQYYLVANPYTAPISLKTILAENTNLSKTVAYYNPEQSNGGILTVKAGGYEAKDTSLSATSGDANDVVIPPMGAIFVQAPLSQVGNVDITISKNAIFTGTNNSGTYTHKTAQAKIASTNALKVQVNSDGTYYDTVALRFKEVGSTGSNIDFGKLPNSVLDVYSMAGSQKMAVSELELKAQTISLGITSTVQKSYTFKVVENTIPAGFEAVLVDKMLNTDTVLTSGMIYNFAIDGTPASQGDTRFAINLRTAGSLDVKANELDAAIQVYPNPSRGQFNISNAVDAATNIEISSLNGRVIHAQKLNSGTTTIQTKSWATGVYILKTSNNGTQTTKKLIIQ